MFIMSQVQRWLCKDCARYQSLIGSFEFVLFFATLRDRLRCLLVDPRQEVCRCERETEGGIRRNQSQIKEQSKEAYMSAEDDELDDCVELFMAAARSL